MIRAVFGSRRDVRKAMRSLVWLNGVEVTKDCQYADDRVGRVLLLKRNENGAAYYDRERGQVARDWKHGKVEIRTRRGKAA